MDTSKATTTPPQPSYRPRVTVQGDKLPRRYRRGRALDKAARRALLADIYFGEDKK